MRDNVTERGSLSHESCLGSARSGVDAWETTRGGQRRAKLDGLMRVASIYSNRTRGEEEESDYTPGTER